MSDLDLLESFAHETVHQVLAPDFDALVTTSRRRRLTTLVATGCVAAAAVGIITIGAQAVGDNQSGPVQPGPATTHVSTPRTSPTTSSNDSQNPQTLRPQAIVSSATGGPAHLAVSADDSKVEATSWQACRTHVCRQYVGAIAVTSDGFVHAHDVVVAPFADLRWLSGETFVTQLPSGQLASVSTDGTVKAIPITTDASPLHSGEVLFLEGGWQGPPGRRYLAVDSTGTTAHPVSVPYPSNSYVSLAQAGPQSLWGIAEVDPSSLISSPDGGTTWRAPYEPTRLSQLDPLDSTAPNTIAALAAGDDDSRSAETLYRSTDAGASWQAIHPAQFNNSGAGWGAVLPDGKLLITVSFPYGSFSAVPRLYESDSADWTYFHVVHPTGGLPDGYLLTATVDGNGAASLWLNGATSLLRSTDSGSSWQRVRAR